MRTHAGHKHGRAEKARHLMRRTGYKAGGHVKDEAAKDVHKHESHMHPGEAKTKLKEGGAVEGKKSGGRLDKMARGGKKGKAHVTVNVMNHPQTPVSPNIPPIPVGLAGAGAGPRPPMPAPSPAAGPAMGMGAPGVPSGGPRPGMMQRGGAVKLANGGQPTQGYSKGKIPGPTEEKHLKTGGRLGGKAAPHMTGGAGSGIGREEKSEAQRKKD